MFQKMTASDEAERSDFRLPEWNFQPKGWARQTDEAVKIRPAGARSPFVQLTARSSAI
jgi:hypothetical protein